MKITVEISDSELNEIRHFTGESKKGPAIRKMVVDALMLKRRQAIGKNFISGKWGTDLPGFEKSRATERKQSRRQAAKWR